MKSKVVAKAILFNEGGEVLLLRRSATDDRRPGEWDYPGGGADPGEDMAEAASREILEEVGLKIGAHALHLVNAKTEIIDGQNVTRLLFWGRPEATDVILSEEHSEFKWMAPEKAVEIFPHPFYGAGLVLGLERDLFTAAG